MASKNNKWIMIGVVILLAFILFSSQKKEAGMRWEGSAAQISAEAQCTQIYNSCTLPGGCGWLYKTDSTHYCVYYGDKFPGTNCNDNPCADDGYTFVSYSGCHRTAPTESGICPPPAYSCTYPNANEGQYTCASGVIKKCTSGKWTNYKNCEGSCESNNLVIYDSTTTICKTCIDTTWLPSTDLYEYNVPFTQTSDCGRPRTAYGSRCSYSDWTPSTTTTCSDKQFTQTRTVLGGTCTESLQRTVYGTKECGVDCTYSAWTPSTSLTCPTEKVAQTRTVLTGTGCTGLLTQSVDGTKTCEPPAANETETEETETTDTSANVTADKCFAAATCKSKGLCVIGEKNKCESACIPFFSKWKSSEFDGEDEESGCVANWGSIGLVIGLLIAAKMFGGRKP